jgi:hypothetical protein
LKSRQNIALIIITCFLTQLFFWGDVASQTKGEEAKRKDSPWILYALKTVGAGAVIGWGNVLIIQSIKAETSNAYLHIYLKKFAGANTEFERRMAARGIVESLKQAETRKPFNILSKAGKEFLDKILKEGVENLGKEALPAASKLTKRWLGDLLFLAGGVAIIGGSWFIAIAFAAADVATDSSPLGSSEMAPQDIPRDYIFFDCYQKEEIAAAFHNTLSDMNKNQLVKIYDDPALSLGEISLLLEQPEADYRLIIGDLYYYFIKTEINRILYAKHGVKRDNEQAELVSDYMTGEANGDNRCYREIGSDLCGKIGEYQDLMGKILNEPEPVSAPTSK